MAYSAATWLNVLFAEIGGNQEVTYSISWDTQQGWDPDGWTIIPYVYPLYINNPAFLPKGPIGGSIEITRSWITRFAATDPSYPLITFFFTVKNLNSQLCRFSIFNANIPPPQ